MLESVLVSLKEICTSTYELQQERRCVCQKEGWSLCLYGDQRAIPR